LHHKEHFQTLHMQIFFIHWYLQLVPFICIKNQQREYVWDNKKHNLGCIAEFCSLPIEGTDLFF
jgi:hypothetical protein